MSFSGSAAVGGGHVSNGSRRSVQSMTVEYRHFHENNYPKPANYKHFPFDASAGWVLIELNAGAIIRVKTNENKSITVSSANYDHVVMKYEPIEETMKGMKSRIAHVIDGEELFDFTSDDILLHKATALNMQKGIGYTIDVQAPGRVLLRFAPRSVPQTMFPGNCFKDSGFFMAQFQADLLRYTESKSAQSPIVCRGSDVQVVRIESRETQAPAGGKRRQDGGAGSVFDLTKTPSPTGSLEEDRRVRSRMLEASEKAEIMQRIASVESSLEKVGTENRALATRVDMTERLNLQTAGEVQILQVTVEGQGQISNKMLELMTQSQQKLRMLENAMAQRPEIEFNAPRAITNGTASTPLIAGGGSALNTPKDSGSVSLPEHEDVLAAGLTGDVNYQRYLAMRNVNSNSKGPHP